MPYLYEVIGFTGAVLVSVSLCMTRIKSLRAVNLSGALVFIAYGLLIRSPPVILLNAVLVCVNIWYLVKAYGETARGDIFDVMFANPEDDFVRRFVQFHHRDILRFFPSFDADPEQGSFKNAECCFILRETLPVSLVAFRRGEDDEITITLDYAIPAYRDMKNARFFFSRVIGSLSKPGAVLLASGEVRAHANYLHKLGFTETGRSGNTVHFRRAV
jgi:hypothetical protein